ncbi:TNF(Tumour Necrosis Factor) family [Nesidiocoris tenuis]|uniref:TNF(Tumour Necrosis Factor) family n=1 Tax=Nesidiocoris tenuis TaxID=355587 RepID=A0ABN7AK12_9HEMI|nr:TNF(Tumour Necrosis Factor) family [Nesidiocoris tenuis]
MIIGGAITYLELRRNVEINALDALVFRLREKVDRLESEIDAMKNNTSYRLDQLERKSNTGAGVAPEEGDYYDDASFDEYDDDAIDDDTGATSGGAATGSGGRTRRRRRSNAASASAAKDDGPGSKSKRNILPFPAIASGSPNSILRQSYAKPGNSTRDRIEAEIILETQRPQEQPAYEIWKKPDTSCCKPIAAHFEGDISMSGSTKTTHYQGNHRVFQSGVIAEWEPARWMHELGQTSSFHLDSGRSEVSIKEESRGVYYVYAQVFYADSHDTAGFGIFVNHENVFQCTVTSLHHMDTHRHRVKSNSCYTGGLVKLAAGDKVTLREIEGTRSTVMNAPKSFFGMYRVYVS